MRNKLLLSILLLVMLFSFGSCGYRYGHFRHTHYHWGSGKHYSVRHAYWGKHRYGPRPHTSRGKYRD